MPERTYNLDDAFAALSEDVGSSTHTRGADAAIRTAGRRRTALIGSLAAGTLAVAAVLVTTISLPDQQVEPPIAAPAAPTLPAAAPATTERFQQATTGWTPTWTTGSSPVLTDDPCGDEKAKLPEPKASTSAEYRLGDRAGASRVTAVFADPTQAQAAWNILRAPSPACAGATLTPVISAEAGGVAFASTTRSLDATLDSTTWYTVVGDKVSILTVSGVDQTPPETVVREVTDVLLADLNR